MKRTIALSLLLTGILSACATMDTVRAQNRANLNRLALGMTKEEVLAVMGTKTVTTYRDGVRGEQITNPYRTEVHQAGGHVWEILFYYTDNKADDGAITDDELTPIVLKDGRLDGWGWSYWQDIVRTYEIRVR